MSALVDAAIERAGLGAILVARAQGAVPPEAIAVLRQADLLVVGALADRVRVVESGDEVRIYVAAAPKEPSVVVLPSEDAELRGLDMLREVAIARITGPRGTRVRVDWTRSGLELAQVALGFGADEIAGTIATKRGLPIAEGELVGVGKKSRRELAHLVKRKELAGYVRRAGRTPVFVGPDGAPDPEQPEAEPADAGDIRGGESAAEAAQEAE